MTFQYVLLELEMTTTVQGSHRLLVHLSANRFLFVSIGEGRVERGERREERTGEERRRREEGRGGEERRGEERRRRRRRRRGEERRGEEEEERRGAERRREKRRREERTGAGEDRSGRGQEQERRGQEQEQERTGDGREKSKQIFQVRVARMEATKTKPQTRVTFLCLLLLDKVNRKPII